MDILQYLIELLKNRKQIGIEGLGTFYKKKTPGRYDAETHSFLPPSYALEFTADVLENTNLVEYIQAKRGISQESVKYFISQFVEEVQKGLQQGTYTLDNLGDFEITDSKLLFIPSQNINTGFDFFALPAVTAEAQQIQSGTEEIVEEISDITLENLAQAVDEPQIEQVQVPEFEQELGKLAATDTEEETTQEEEEEETTAAQQPMAGQEETEEEITTSENDDLAQEFNRAGEEPKETIAEDSVESIENVENIENVEEEDTEEDETEEDTVENEDIAFVSEIENEPSLTENEPTDPEVFEEITEVDTENPINEQESIIDKEENDDWDFDNENVVSEEDVHQEEITEKEVIDELDDQEPAFVSPIKSTDEERDGITLSSTTHEWDFDTIESRRHSEDEPLIGEFDNDQAQEEFEEESRKMPMYQKLSFGLIALLVVFAVLYFVKPDIFENFKRDTTNPDDKIALPIQRSNLKTQQDSISFADSIMQNAEKAGLDVQPAKDTLKVTTSTSTKKAGPTVTTYDIIITSFATEAAAQAYISRMKKKGFDPKISTMEGLRKNISIATYNHIDSAQKHVIKFRKLFKDPEIYIKPIKNN